MKTANIHLGKRPVLNPVLVAIMGAMGMLLLPMFLASCEEEEADCGAYVEYKTGRNKVYKSDLQLHAVAGGGLVAFSDYDNVGEFVFTFVNETKRCSKNPDGYDFLSQIDAWIYVPQWPDADLYYKAEIEMPGLDRKELTPVASGAGPNTIHLTCTNGWMDFAEKDEDATIYTRLYIGYVDITEEEAIVDLLVDSMKLELQYSERYYRL